jgi:hypothetical protein
MKGGTMSKSRWLCIALIALVFLPIGNSVVGQPPGSVPERLQRLENENKEIQAELGLLKNELAMLKSTVPTKVQNGRIFESDPNGVPLTRCPDGTLPIQVPALIRIGSDGVRANLVKCAEVRLVK